MDNLNLTEFGKLFKQTLRQFKHANAHQKLLLTYSVFLSFLFMYIVGNILTIPLTFIFGIAYEMTYCFVPHKDVLIFGEKEYLPDYPKFINYLNNGKVINRHKFNQHNFNFVIVGIIIAILMKLFFFLPL